MSAPRQPSDSRPLAARFRRFSGSYSRKQEEKAAARRARTEDHESGSGGSEFEEEEEEEDVADKPMCVWEGAVPNGTPHEDELEASQTEIARLHKLIALLHQRAAEGPGAISRPTPPQGPTPRHADTNGSAPNHSPSAVSAPLHSRPYVASDLAYYQGPGDPRNSPYAAGPYGPPYYGPGAPYYPPHPSYPMGMPVYAYGTGPSGYGGPRYAGGEGERGEGSETRVRQRDEEGIRNGTGRNGKTEDGRGQVEGVKEMGPEKEMGK